MNRLGQNFLTSKQIAERMVDTARVGPKDIVLEIGPGRGILTEELLKRAKKIVAVEKDVKLFNFLSECFEKFVKSGKLDLINADIRDFIKNPVKHLVFNKIVANIPYYLTGQLLRLLLAQMYQVRLNTIVLMLQKEVARRITSSGKNSVLTISVRVFAEPKTAFYVKNGNFWPQPKVDSAVVVFEKRKGDFFKEHKIDQKGFFDVVKAGFAHPRKLLKNNLALSKTEFLTGCGVAKNARAEDLSLENWACLARYGNDGYGAGAINRHKV